MQAILFDLDGTLLDRGTCVRKCIEDQFLRFADRLAPLTIEKFVASFTTLDQHGYVPKPAVYEGLRLEFGLPSSLTKVLTSDYFLTYPRFCVGFPYMFDILSRLRDRGLKLAIVTNGLSSLQSAVIQALRIEHFFDTIVISEAEGVSKPDRRIFDLTLDRLGITPADAAFVGDHPETDIRGAQHAGMRAIWIRGDHWGPCPFADAEVGELSELPGVLERF